jgi:hypothetical protein
MQAIEPSTPVMITINTDRKKVLQTGVLMRVRAMRSVLCSVYEDVVVLAAATSPTVLLESPLNVVVAEDLALGGLGPLARLVGE